MTAIAPQFVARRLDARYNWLVAAASNLADIAGTVLADGGNDLAADLMAEARGHLAEAETIRACWV